MYENDDEKIRVWNPIILFIPLPLYKRSPVNILRARHWSIIGLHIIDMIIIFCII